MRAREITLTLTVTVPAVTGENEVETAINAALDEGDGSPNCWGEWRVGAATIATVRAVEVEPGYFGPFDEG